MPVFVYTARDSAGTIRKGSSEGESDSVVVRRLQDQGYTILKLQRVKNAKAAAEEQEGRKKTASYGFGRVSLRDLAVFCRQFSTMIDAGVSLIRCLAVLQEQSSNAKLKAIISDVAADVQAGQTLSKAMSRHPGTFNSLFLGLVKSGEVSGALEESLQRLAIFLEKDVELRRKVRSALTYPFLLMCIMVAIIIVLVTFVVPRFMGMFFELGMRVTDMPAPTRLMITVSNFLTTRWWLGILIVVVLVMAVRLFGQTKFGRRAIDFAKLKLPVFGALNLKICLARFSRTLSTLLGSGVPILQSMETVAGAVANEIIGDAVLEARTRIREGDRIGDPLQKSKMFPPMVVQMISIGEESGSLDLMLSKIADFYESEVDAAVANLTSAIEPLMIIMLGGCVGFIVISMFLPMLKIIENLGNFETG